MVSVRLPEDLETKLEELALKTKRSKSFYIKEAVESYLEDLEDGYIALQRLNDPKAEYMTTDRLLFELGDND